MSGVKLACDYRNADGKDRITTVKLSKDGQFSVDRAMTGPSLYYVCASSHIEAGRLFLVKDKRRN